MRFPTRYIRRSKKLRYYAESIFGDLVKDVFLCAEPTANIDDAIAFFENACVIGDEGDIGFDGVTLCVVFRNGKKVEFWNDLHGGFRKSEGEFRDLKREMV